MFKGIPVREARASIYVQPSEADISKATRESPTNCAYAVTLKRVLNCKNVFVFKTTAYIEGLDEAGRPLMERYKVKKYARDYVVRFDHGEKVPPGGFVFHKPELSQTLDYKQAQQIRRAKAGKQSPRVSKAAPVKVRQFRLRDGKGCVHLYGTDDQIKVWAK